MPFVFLYCCKLCCHVRYVSFIVQTFYITCSINKPIVNYLSKTRFIVVCKEKLSKVFVIIIIDIIILLIFFISINSILNFLAQTLQSTSGFDLFSVLPGFKNPSIVTPFNTFQLQLVTPFVQICYWHPQINHCCTLSSSLLAMSPIFIKTLYGRRTNINSLGPV